MKSKSEGTRVAAVESAQVVNTLDLETLEAVQRLSDVLYINPNLKNGVTHAAFLEHLKVVEDKAPIEANKVRVGNFDVPAPGQRINSHNESRGK